MEIRLLLLEAKPAKNNSHGAIIVVGLRNPINNDEIAEEQSVNRSKTLQRRCGNGWIKVNTRWT